MPNLFGGPEFELGIVNQAFGMTCFENGIECPYLGYGTPGIFYWKNDGFQDVGAPFFLPGICGCLFLRGYFKW